MRTILFIFIVILFSAPLSAQNNRESNYLNSSHKHNYTDSSNLKFNNSDKKWALHKYLSITTGMSFFNGGTATIFSAPIGLQLNRKLTNNWYAFAGVSATPAMVSFNSSISSLTTNKSFQPNGMFYNNHLGLYPKAELGLMYINDQKTFSISGSISVERYNSYTPFNNVNTFTPHNLNSFSRGGLR